MFEIDDKGRWTALEDKTYEAGQWDTKALTVGSAYTLNFTGLKPDTSYGLRFYGLNDLDYDNRLNIIQNSVPLRDNAPNALLYTNLAAHYQNGTAVVPGITALYQNYLEIDSANEAANLKIADAENANDVLLRSYGPVKTFSASQIATAGEWYQTDVFAEDRAVKLYFQGAFGLNEVNYVDYTIGFYGNANPVSGRIYATGGSIMDSGGTSGDVTLTIQNDHLDLSNAGNYYIQLELHQADGTTLEKPPTIEFVVK